MNFNLLTKIAQILRNKQRYSRWQKVVSCMAAVVVFCTTYALILPAITMTTTCGLDEHTHTAACYANDDTLLWLCQQEEQEMAVHQHDETCYDENGLLICGIADFVLHTHDADTCYDAEGNLVCTLPEIASYSKTTLFLVGNEDDADYEDSGDIWVSTPSSLQFDLFIPEGTEDTDLVLPDGYTVLDSQEPEVWTEAHTHSADCYDQDGKLICGQLDVAQHQHTLDCLQGTLICGLEEHQHSQDCYASAEDAQTYLCGLDEHQHGEACYDDEGNLICTLEEHTHTEACLAQKAQQEEETEQTLTAQVNDATISVTFPIDALPEGVVLQAQEIAQDSDDYAAYYQQALQAMQDQAETELTLSFARFFDITFLADGAEVEPTAPVAVTITYADGIALAGNESSSAVHFADDGIQVLDVQTEGSGDTVDTFTFTQDSFSVTGMVVALTASTYTVEAGQTVTITGAASAYSHSWSSEDTDIATVSGDGRIATVTGVAAGETTITHIYGKNKNNISTETFTLIVTAAEEETELKASGNGFTVKVTGNKNKLPDNVELVVEEVTAGYDDDSYYNAMIDGLNEAGAATTTLQHGSEHATTDFDFLHLYHIWLRRADGTEYALNEADNLNLNVTITYTENTETPEGWESLKANGAWVGHYKKENGSIVAKSIAETGPASTLTPKNIKVKGNSISFHIKSFSTFPVAALAATEIEETEITTVRNDYDDTPATTTARNNWQVVSHNYIGSGLSYTYSDDYAVRIRKTVEATGNENEFKIHLTVEPEAKEIQDVLSMANFAVVHNNSASEGDILNISSGVSPLIPQHQYNAMSTEEQQHWHPIEVTYMFAGKIDTTIEYVLVSEYGNYTKKNVISPVPNGGAGISLDGGKTYICVTKKGTMSLTGVENDSYDNIIKLDISENDLADYITITSSSTIPNNVTDPMGEGITYTDNYLKSAGSVIEPSDGNNNTLTWQLPTTTEMDASKKVAVTVADGTTHIYYKNAYTLEYTIKLTNYQSCGLDDNGNPIKTENIVNTNGTTTLTYRVDTEKSGKETEITTGTPTNINFEIPQVVGLKYELKLKKVDSTDETKTLAGATFGLYKDLDCMVPATDESGGAITAISDANGIIDFQNLSWGTYYVKETAPPAGYKASETPAKMYMLCYTTAPSALTGQGANKEALYDATNNPIENTPTSKSIILQKVSATDSSTSLAGAAFTLYQVDENGDKVEGTEMVSLTSDENGVFSPADFTLATGTYHLIETKAPDGYHLLAEPVVIMVSSDGVSAYPKGDATAQLTVTKEDDDDDTTTYTILVTNSTGTALPETGGAGAEGYQLAGLLLMLTAAVWLWKQKQLRERGNVHSPKA